MVIKGEEIMSRCGEAVSRLAHNQKIAGANPATATKRDSNGKLLHTYTCSECQKTFYRERDAAKLYKFCGVQCSYSYKGRMKKLRQSQRVSTPFDKRLIDLKKQGHTYQQISDIMTKEGLQGPRGKPNTRVYMQTRFNYIIGRNEGVVKVWRQNVRFFKIPKAFEVRMNEEVKREIEVIKQEIKEIKTCLEKHQLY
jgi:hypothetical protein